MAITKRCWSMMLVVCLCVQHSPHKQHVQLGATPATPATIIESMLSPLFNLSCRMGVCSGAPQAVTPDHQGRADYHGNAVNMAAR